jgi:hypothetical protein
VVHFDGPPFFSLKSKKAFIRKNMCKDLFGAINERGYKRLHSLKNLIMMPLSFAAGASARDLNLTGISKNNERMIFF